MMDLYVSKRTDEELAELLAKVDKVLDTLMTNPSAHDYALYDKYILIKNTIAWFSGIVETNELFQENDLEALGLTREE